MPLNTAPAGITARPLASVIAEPATAVTISPFLFVRDVMVSVAARSILVPSLTFGASTLAGCGLG